MLRIPIIQGEHAVVTRPGILITTVLGSCVSVCLFDPGTRIGGMNHFLLGEPGENDVVSRDDLVRYGVHAMELLINDMMHHGASRDHLKAHLYGGAKVVAGLGDVGARNIEFARRFLAAEGISVGHADVGGTRARKVEFLPHEGKARAVMVKDVPPPVLKPVRVQGEVELF